MAQREELIPPAVRIALRNAVGGWGPYSVRQINDLFLMHGFTEVADVADAGGDRRTTAEEFHARIDWTSPDHAQRYLDLVSDVLEHYPPENDEPGSPGRVLRRALERGRFVRPDGSLGLPVGRPEPVEPDVEGIWIPDRPRVFMSHVSTAREPVSEVAQGLESFQCSCFVAHVQIEPSRDWQDTIEVALQTCQVLVAWVTPEFPKSKWTDQEVGWVLARGIPVIPVNAGLQPYGFFGAKQSLPASPWGWTTASNIFRTFAVPALRAQPPPGSPEPALVARTIVRAFCDSPSYDSTRDRFPLLEQIPPRLWTTDMLNELDAAADLNRQIREAGLREPRMDAPEAVRALIRRVGRGGAS